MLAERPNLINGGIQYFNLDKNKEALKFFATYVESASYPMLADKELAKKRYSSSANCLLCNISC